MVFQQSLEIELRLRNLPYLTQVELEVFYKNTRLETKYIPDLMVFGEIVVELKAVKELLSEYDTQLFNYMRIARKRIGYLVNSGKSGDLQWKRFVLDDLKIQEAILEP